MDLTAILIPWVAFKSGFVLTDRDSSEARSRDTRSFLDVT
jgi:hypothetical protein